MKGLIQIRNLEKTFPSDRGPVRAVQGMDLDVDEGEFAVLLGPSGCGKTTTLRCVAGLERPDRGSIQIAGEEVDSAEGGSFVPPERRNIGMVFQSYAVWPHLNVYQNVALPLAEGRRRIPKNQVRGRVQEALEVVRLGKLDTRPVTDLSGGQQQRVALARAIVTHPKVLLMDEPLSNLDARLREQMRIELRKITSSIGVTTLYVTHDQAEALSLGDRVCVMNEGEILQNDSPQEVYSHPPSLFVAQFVGEMNFIMGKITGESEVELPLGRLRCKVPTGCKAGSNVTLAIRPEHLSFMHGSNQSCQSFEGKVLTKSYLGDSALFEVEVSGVALIVKLPGDTDCAVGQQVRVAMPAERWYVYP
jgi:iron(III) transport system ATP-binding protein